MLAINSGWRMQIFRPPTRKTERRCWDQPRHRTLPHGKTSRSKIPIRGSRWKSTIESLTTPPSIPGHRGRPARVLHAHHVPQGGLDTTTGLQLVPEGLDIGRKCMFCNKETDEIIKKYNLTQQYKREKVNIKKISLR